MMVRGMGQEPWKGGLLPGQAAAEQPGGVLWPQREKAVSALQPRKLAAEQGVTASCPGCRQG